nr:MAG TPA: hypothetical protein [Caudoviricetes sp.]
MRIIIALRAYSTTIWNYTTCPRSVALISGKIITIYAINNTRMCKFTIVFKNNNISNFWICI